jgi:hypothetical protein
MSIFANSMTLYKLAVAFNVGVDKEVFGYNVVEVCGSLFFFVNSRNFIKKKGYKDNSLTYIR